MGSWGGHRHALTRASARIRVDVANRTSCLFSPFRANSEPTHHPTVEATRFIANTNLRSPIMHGIIYLVGLVVVVLAILSFFGLG